jgi:hypothetical protein
MIEPNFDRDRFEGQMNYTERELLYQYALLSFNADLPEAWEVGTARGGGSTYYLACAAHNAGKGRVITCENHPEFYEYARKLYGDGGPLHELEHCINFNFGDAVTLYKPLLEHKGEAWFVLLDSGPDSMEIVWQYAMFRPYMPIGAQLLIHDWDNGKTDYLRPLLENDCDWKMKFFEIGLAIFERVGHLHA